MTRFSLPMAAVVCGTWVAAGEPNSLATNWTKQNGGPAKNCAAGWASRCTFCLLTRSGGSSEMRRSEIVKRQEVGNEYLDAELSSLMPSKMLENRSLNEKKRSTAVPHQGGGKSSVLEELGQTESHMNRQWRDRVWDKILRFSNAVTGEVGRTSRFYWQNRAPLLNRIGEYLAWFDSDVREREIRVSTHDSHGSITFLEDRWSVRLPNCCVVCGKVTQQEREHCQRRVTDVTWSLWMPTAGLILGGLLFFTLGGAWYSLPVFLLSFLPGYWLRREVLVDVEVQRCDDHANLKTVPLLFVFADSLLIRTGDPDVKRQFRREDREAKVLRDDRVRDCWSANAREDNMPTVALDRPLNPAPDLPTIPLDDEETLETPNAIIHFDNSIGTTGEADNGVSADTGNYHSERDRTCHITTANSGTGAPSRDVTDRLPSEEESLAGPALSRSLSGSHSESTTDEKDEYRLAAELELGTTGTDHLTDEHRGAWHSGLEQVGIRTPHDGAAAIKVGEFPLDSQHQSWTRWSIFSRSPIPTFTIGFSKGDTCLVAINETRFRVIDVSQRMVSLEEDIPNVKCACIHETEEAVVFLRTEKGRGLGLARPTEVVLWNAVSGEQNRSRNTPSLQKLVMSDRPDTPIGYTSRNMRLSFAAKSDGIRLHGNGSRISINLLDEVIIAGVTGTNGRCVTPARYDKDRTRGLSRQGDPVVSRSGHLVGYPARGSFYVTFVGSGRTREFDSDYSQSSLPASFLQFSDDDRFVFAIHGDEFDLWDLESRKIIWHLDSVRRTLGHPTHTNVRFQTRRVLDRLFGMSHDTGLFVLNCSDGGDLPARHRTETQRRGVSRCSGRTGHPRSDDGRRFLPSVLGMRCTIPAGCDQ
jgi:hypothetical protein